VADAPKYSEIFSQARKRLVMECVLYSHHHVIYTLPTSNMKVE